MSNDVIDRLRSANPHPPVYDIPPLSDEDIDSIVHRAGVGISGPLARSASVAAAVGLVIGLGLVVLWLQGSGNTAATDVTTVTSSTGSTATTELDGAPTTVLESTDTTVGRDGAALGPIEQIKPIDIQCSTQLNDTTLACDNLIDGTTDAWNDISMRGVGAVIEVAFSQPVALEQVQFINLENDTDFRRNYRIRGVEITADDLPGLPFIDEIANDNTRPHAVTVATLGTRRLVIRVVSTWPAEVLGDGPFDELALDEIQFWGRVVDQDAAPTTLMPRTEWLEWATELVLEWNDPPPDPDSVLVDQVVPLNRAELLVLSYTSGDLTCVDLTVVGGDSDGSRVGRCDVPGSGDDPISVAQLSTFEHAGSTITVVSGVVRPDVASVEVMGVEQRFTATLRNGVFLVVAVGDLSDVVVSALDGSGVVMHTSTGLDTLAP